MLPFHHPACQTDTIQDKHRKLCDSRYQEQRNKFGTLGVWKILIKIELAPHVDSAVLLIAILTAMQVGNEQAEPEAIRIPGTDGPAQPGRW